MKVAVPLGLALVFVGVLLAIFYQDYPWLDGKPEIAKYGPVDVERGRGYPMPLRVLLAGAFIGLGLALLSMATRQSD